MNQYKVVQGMHVEDGRTYNQGQTFNSWRELDKMFPGKFENLGPAQVKQPASSGAASRKRPTPTFQPVQEELPESETDEEEDEEEDEDEKEEKPQAKSTFRRRRKRRSTRT